MKMNKGNQRNINTAYTTEKRPEELPKEDVYSDPIILNLSSITAMNLLLHLCYMGVQGKTFEIYMW